MLKVQGRYFARDGEPFFWLGDTCWLMFSRMTREEMAAYFALRRRQGFTVILATLVHTPRYADREGHPALKNDDFSRPDTEGGYWDTVDAAVREAGRQGLCLALVLCWGSFVERGRLSAEDASAYAAFLGKRLGRYDHVIFLLGGDIRGSVNPELFRSAGRALRLHAPDCLIGYHPFGRTSSGDWFRGEDWLDFHLFQSGHRDRNQRVLGAWDDSPVPEEEWMGEDSYRYVLREYARDTKPVLDGEPSYEDIPHGLHDPSLPRWGAREVRRYAWWSCLSGAAGFTYGHNSVMQVWREGEKGSFGVRVPWDRALVSEGAASMHVVRDTLEKLRFEKARYAPEAIGGGAEEGDGKLVALRGEGCLAVYSYLPQPVRVREDALGFAPALAFFLDPATGERQEAVRGEGAFLRRGGTGDAVLLVLGEKAAERWND